MDKLANYVSLNGRKFYGYDSEEEMWQGRIKLRKLGKLGKVESASAATVPAVYVHPELREVSDSEAGKVQVVPFWAGKRLGWEIVRS